MVEEQPKPTNAQPPPDHDTAATRVAAGTLTSKTPFFEAIHSARYQRQALISRIQRRSERSLICYVAGSDASLSRDDTLGFVDLLHHLGGAQAIDLVLHTGGGDIDAAEKLMSMVRAKAVDREVRVVVPDFAKSAGTLMCLGADRLVMSDVSELGPIDPQVVLADANGNRIRHSVQSYLDAYDSLCRKLTETPDNVAAQIMLKKLDPATIKLFEAVRERARQVAEKHLQRGMFREGGNWSRAAAELLNTNQWQSHGQMISWQDAVDSKLGLKVDYMAPSSDAWQEYWQLYCMQRLSITDRQKLFESDYVSITIDSTP